LFLLVDAKVRKGLLVLSRPVDVGKMEEDGSVVVLYSEEPSVVHSVEDA
jgi:hypothetical protein